MYDVWKMYLNSANWFKFGMSEFQETAMKLYDKSPKWKKTADLVHILSSTFRTLPKFLVD
jgi:hypothetical protein